MSDLRETIDQSEKVNSVRWYGHVLRKDKNNLLEIALDFIVKGTREGKRPMKTWLKTAVEHNRKVGRNESNTNNRSR